MPQDMQGEETVKSKSSFDSFLNIQKTPVVPPVTRNIMKKQTSLMVGFNEKSPVKETTI